MELLAIIGTIISMIFLSSLLCFGYYDLHKPFKDEKIVEDNGPKIMHEPIKLKH